MAYVDMMSLNADGAMSWRHGGVGQWLLPVTEISDGMWKWGIIYVRCIRL